MLWQARQGLIAGRGALDGAAAGGGGGYTATGVHFASTTGLTSGPFSGVTDSKLGTLSFWFKAGGSDGDTFRILADNNGHFLVDRLTSGSMRIIAADSSGTNSFVAPTTSTVFTAANGGWHHFLASWDTAVVIRAYIDGVADGVGTPANITLAYATGLSQWRFPDNGLPIVADIADFWFAPGVFIDLLVAGNRQKFINAGIPVDLGATGNLPTGTAPALFLSGAAASWHTNKGTGGGMTLASGTITTASSNPP